MITLEIRLHLKFTNVCDRKASLRILKLTWVPDGTRLGAVGLIFWYELHQVGDNTQNLSKELYLCHSKVDVLMSALELSAVSSLGEGFSVLWSVMSVFSLDFEGTDDLNGQSDVFRNSDPLSQLQSTNLFADRPRVPSSVGF